ncbi:MAG TPA: phosphotransferase [Steroidobacteraceae bacterium]|nr:phosphotransferase [Steroidobacteraceae bacterium]
MREVVAEPPTRLLEVPPPAIDVGAASAIAAQYFGEVGRATPLSSERDCNFLLATGAERLLLKISNPAEEPAAVDAQTRALTHIADKDPTLPVPRVRQTKSGEPWTYLPSPQGRLIARLLDFLPGQPLSGAPRSGTQRRGIGALLGRLNCAMRDFTHAGAERPLLWDLSRTHELGGLLHHIADGGRRAQVRRFLDRFASHALPVLQNLRTQVLHNDFNPHNLLVHTDAPDRISGIIDFGDMVRGPLINDLAVAAAYHVPSDGPPLAQVVDLVTAYHSITPLQYEELGILPDLIAARQAITVIITAWRAALHPENAPYILRNAPTAWHGLERLNTLPRGEARAILRTACGMPA